VLGEANNMEHKKDRQVAKRPVDGLRNKLQTSI
jgi:hypothetical protein